DLGMLASTAAYFYVPREGRDATAAGSSLGQGPQIIEHGETRSPHLRNMLWSAGKNYRIGSGAAALRQQAPHQVIHNVQRWIGVRELPVPFCGLQVPPEVALGAFLRQIMMHSAAATDNATDAVVTVPSC